MTTIALFIPLFALIGLSVAHIRSANRVKRPALRLGGRWRALASVNPPIYLP